MKPRLRHETAIFNMRENAFDKQVLVFLVENYFASVKLFQIFTPLINSLCFKDIKTI